MLNTIVAISGIPTPPTVSVDFLVIAGGGGAGNGVLASTNGGAGGAGGYRTSYSTSGGGGAAESKLTLTPGVNYTVTVGAGGANGDPGVVGNNSVFSSITSMAAVEAVVKVQTLQVVMADPVVVRLMYQQQVAMAQQIKVTQVAQVELARLSQQAAVAVQLGLVV